MMINYPAELDKTIKEFAKMLDKHYRYMLEKYTLPQEIIEAMNDNVVNNSSAMYNIIIESNELGVVNDEMPEM